jgi:hypothetical protein
MDLNSTVFAILGIKLSRIFSPYGKWLLHTAFYPDLLANPGIKLSPNFQSLWQVIAPDWIGHD